jgi:short-subunit dehydrogenase
MILITGASCNVGKEVLKQIAQQVSRCEQPSSQ